MRAAIYTRISKDLRDGAGVARQERECRKLCEEKGWEIVDVFSDNDISAFGKKERPAFNQMLKLVEQGKVDVLVAWDTDRFYRRNRDLDKLIDICEETPFQVRTINSQVIDLNTAQGRYMARILVANSSWEVDHQIDRQKAAHSDRALRGRYRGGPVPFGFRRVQGKPGYLEHDPKSAEALRWGVAHLLAGGTLGEVGREWAKRGVIKPHKNNRSNRVDVRRRLKSSRIAGLETHNGETYPATTYEGIISESDWRAVNALITSRHSGARSPGQERKYLGTGVYRCGKGDCNGTMVTVKHTARGDEARRYVCRVCQGVSRNIIRVDELVVDTIIHYLEANKLAVTKKQQGSQIKKLLAEKRSIEERMKLTGEMFATGEVTKTQFLTMNKTLIEDLEHIESQIDREAKSEPLAKINLEGNDIRKAWDSLTIEQQANVIRDLVTVRIRPQAPGVLFEPEAIEFEWLL